MSQAKARGQLEIIGVRAPQWAEETHSPVQQVIIGWERLAGSDEDVFDLARYLSSGNDCGAVDYSPGTGGGTLVRDRTTGEELAWYRAGEVASRDTAPFTGRDMPHARRSTPPAGKKEPSRRCSTPPAVTPPSGRRNEPAEGDDGGIRFTPPPWPTSEDASPPDRGPDGGLWRTTVVIWSRYSGDLVELSELAREAEMGDAYCSVDRSEFVTDPASDPDWDGTEFFGVLHR